MDIKKPETYSNVVYHLLVHYFGPFSSIQSGLGELWAKKCPKTPYFWQITTLAPSKISKSTAISLKLTVGYQTTP